MGLHHVWGLVLALLGAATASDITIGGLMGWGMGMQYSIINASVGDVLVFNYDKGQHDVWQVPGPRCDFNKSVELADVTKAGGYRVRLNKPGKYYFACSVEGHCDSGMLLTVAVSATPRPAGSPPPDSPANPVYMPAGPAEVGEGNCSTPQPVAGSNDTYFVQCLSAGWPMKPGDVINAFYSLPLPYPANSMIALEQQSSQVVDDTLRPVPLSEVYVHHFFGDARNVMAEGAELRGTMKSTPLPAPFARVFNSSVLAQPSSRAVNVHIIQTSGVQPIDLYPCVECWCRKRPDWLEKMLANKTDSDNSTSSSLGAEMGDRHGNASHEQSVKMKMLLKNESRGNALERLMNGQYLGGTACCTSDNCPTTLPPVPTVYHLQYNVTFSLLSADSPPVEPVHLYFLDLVAGHIEYDVLHKAGVDVDVLEQEGAFDERCPQPNSFSIVRCAAHQHIGGQCMELYDVQSGDLICKSCPTYGNSSSIDEVGNERGYLVEMTPQTLDVPYKMSPGQKVRLVSKYNSRTDHYGVMALFSTVLADWDPACSGPIPTEKGVFGPPHQQSRGTFFGYTTPDEQSKQSS